MENMLTRLICFFSDLDFLAYPKWKNWIFGKGFFTAIKEHLCLTKEHLDNPEGPVEVESLNRNMFLTNFIQIEIFFSKRTFLAKLLNVVVHYEQWTFIDYDPAGKERNNFEQPKINWKFIPTNNSHWLH